MTRKTLMWMLILSTFAAHTVMADQPAGRLQELTVIRPPADPKIVPLDPDHALLIVRSPLSSLTFQSHWGIKDMDSGESGRWLLTLEPGSHRLTIQAEGHRSIEDLMLDIGKGETQVIEVDTRHDSTETLPQQNPVEYRTTYVNPPGWLKWSSHTSFGAALVGIVEGVRWHRELNQRKAAYQAARQNARKKYAHAQKQKIIGVGFIPHTVNALIDRWIEKQVDQDLGDQGIRDQEAMVNLKKKSTAAFVAAGVGIIAGNYFQYRIHKFSRGHVRLQVRPKGLALAIPID